MRFGRFLVTGASGYVGGRLVRELEGRGAAIRCLARRPEYVKPKVNERTEVVGGDVLDLGSLRGAMAGVDVAYYLIHSMASTGDFEAADRGAAVNFATAAREAGVRRIVYLGGLGREPGLSRHLRSRQEVGRILRESGVPTVELRASLVIGSGSLSFEMVRALVQKLPVMITPRWVSQPAQPLAIEDLIAYLVHAAEVDLRESVVVEVGGADRVSYLDVMREFARQRGLRRLMIRVPVLSPRLSSLWLGLVTPLYARVGRQLVDSIRNPTTVDDDSARRLFPSVRPRGIREAIARAVVNEDRELAMTRWADALSSGAVPQWGGVAYGSRIVDSRSVRLPRAPEEAFAPVRRIGGDTGWYYADWLWRLRGFLDLLVGGVGTRRGRRDPENLACGDVLDFWRVEAIEPDRLLRLAAEMKLPGRAWLQFEVEPDDRGSVLRQTAIFDPRGLSGLLYWYLLYPLHKLVFAGMLRGIVEAMGRGVAPRAPGSPPMRVEGKLPGAGSRSQATIPGSATVATDLEPRILAVESALIALSIAAIAAADHFAAPGRSLGYLYLIPMSYSALTHRWPVFLLLLAACVWLRQWDTPVESQTWARLAVDWSLVAAFLAVVVPLRRLGRARAAFFRIAQEQRDELVREIQMAAGVQQHLLDQHQPPAGALDVVARMEPARVVGGDYYDFVPLDAGRLAVVVADVSGKGLPAALLMPAVKIALRALAARNASSAELLAELNRVFLDNLPPASYFTLIYAVFDPVGGRLLYANAGHPPALHLESREGEGAWLMPGGPAIGLLHEEVHFETVEVPFGPGDLFVFYTDGITEAEDAAGAEFGRDGVLTAVRASGHPSAESVVSAVHEAVGAFRGEGPRSDDATVIVVRVPAASD